MKFSKQVGSVDCGPTALANALKFLGIASYSGNEEMFASLCKCDKGTWIINMERAGRALAEKHSFEFQKMREPSWAKMRRAMDDGWGLIVAYNWRHSNGGHFVFVVKDDNGYLTANDSTTDSHNGELEHRYTPWRTWLGRVRRGGLHCFKLNCFKVKL